jgi:hypothetical protein
VASSSAYTASAAAENIAEVQKASESNPGKQLSKPTSRDVGTQYTPPGYPPTASGSQIQSKIRLTSGTKVGSELQKSAVPTETVKLDITMTEASTKENSPGKFPEISPEKPPESSTSEQLMESIKSMQSDATITVDNLTNSVAKDKTSSISLSSLVHTVPSSPKKHRSDSSRIKSMPKDYMKCNPTDLGVIIADMLLELIAINDEVPPPKGVLTRFHSRAPPTISVRDYLNRLIFHATLSPPLLLATVYYIDRLCLLYPAFTITSLTVHRFLITATTVAAKGLSDSFWTNHTYARVGGVSTKELAMLELDFLVRLDWGIVPRAEVLEDYYRSLIARADEYVLDSGSEDSTKTGASE